MARTSKEITQHEISAYANFCAEHNIVHDGSQADEANSNLVVDYFLKTWGEDITPENLQQALPQLKPHLKFHSQAEVELRKTAATADPTVAKKFAEWFEAHTFLQKKSEFA